MEGEKHLQSNEIRPSEKAKVSGRRLAPGYLGQPLHLIWLQSPELSLRFSQEPSRANWTLKGAALARLASWITVNLMGLCTATSRVSRRQNLLPAKRRREKTEILNSEKLEYFDRWKVVTFIRRKCTSWRILTSVMGTPTRTSTST